MRKLINVIKDSTRIRSNHKPLYVDIGTNLERIAAPQHQVVFGRRGSGKSCLLLHYRSIARNKGVLPIYIMADELKRLTYPDILIRLIVKLLEEFEKSLRFPRWFRRAGRLTAHYAKELRSLLDTADHADVVERHEQSGETSAGIGLQLDDVPEARISTTEEQAWGRTSRFRERKLDALERHLGDYKEAIIAAMGDRHAAILIDDFYLMPREWQPDIVDYLHRLLRDTSAYLKLATIRHRSRLVREDSQTIGVVILEDIEEINLDRTLEDLDATEGYLAQMLREIGRQVGLPDVVDCAFNPDALRALSLTSGGVPRDFLTIFVSAVEASLADQRSRWLTPKYIYKAAGRQTWRAKLGSLSEDADSEAGGLDRLLADLLQFCLTEKRKTAFLISQDEARSRPSAHELIQQLMDLKLIHVVEPDTSAASGRSGRYEAYTLDFSLFMEPRRRNIEIVEFWKRDEAHRRTGVREAPVYPLERAMAVFSSVADYRTAESVIEESESVAVQSQEVGTQRTSTQNPLLPGFKD